MFRLNLLLRRKNDDLLIFSPAPWFRFLLAALAVVIIIGIITVSGDPESSDDSFREAAGPVIVTVLCVVGMLY